MGESTNPRAKLRFDRRVRLEFHGATITSDAGLLACRDTSLCYDCSIIYIEVKVKVICLPKSLHKASTRFY